MIAVNVGDQNEVGLRKSRKLHRLRGIEINHLPARLNQCAGMIQWCDLHRPGRSLKDLRLGSRVYNRSRRKKKREYEADTKNHCLHPNPHFPHVLLRPMSS